MHARACAVGPYDGRCGCAPVGVQRVCACPGVVVTRAYGYQQVIARVGAQAEVFNSGERCAVQAAILAHQQRGVSRTEYRSYISMATARMNITSKPRGAGVTVPIDRRACTARIDAQGVIATAASDHVNIVVCRDYADAVVARPTDQGVVARPTIDGVIACTRVNIVVGTVGRVVDVVVATAGGD